VAHPSPAHAPTGASDPEASPAALAQRITDLVNGFAVTQVTHAAAHFKLADVLSDVAISADEVARRIGIDPDRARRLLRACVHVGLVRHDAGFVTTPVLGMLKDAPGSLRAFVLAVSGRGHWAPWGRFVDAIQTGQPQAVPALGVELWDYYTRVPAEGALFTDAMTGMTSMVADEVVQAVDLTGSATIADIGGAAGALLIAVMAAYPHLRGILMDRPDVVATVQPPAAMRDRFTTAGGNFFEQVPAADAYLLKHILHDWDDAACLRILTSCARAMTAGSRLFVIEMLVGDDSAPGYPAIMDLHMLVLLGARERTVAHYGELFSAAGLQLFRVTPLRSGYAILEATRAA
jgi:hypothetical protein